MKKYLTLIRDIVIILVILGTCFGTYYFYSKYKKEVKANQEWQKKYDDLIEHPEQLAKSEAELYLEKVKAIEKDVPKDEVPEVQTVLDITQLKDQEFFKDAANGDKILVFKDAKIAIIYRSSENKIIKTGPLITVSQ